METSWNVIFGFISDAKFQYCKDWKALSPLQLVQKKISLRNMTLRTWWPNSSRLLQTCNRSTFVAKGQPRNCESEKKGWLSAWSLKTYIERVPLILSTRTPEGFVIISLGKWQIQNRRTSRPCPSGKPTVMEPEDAVTCSCLPCHVVRLLRACALSHVAFFHPLKMADFNIFQAFLLTLCNWHLCDF